MYEMSASEVAAAVAVYGTILTVSLFFIILTAIGNYKMFKKAGVAGWKAFVPVYNMYCLCEIVFGNGVYFLAFFIPLINTVFHFVLNYKLAKCFRKSFAFFLGLSIFTPIFTIVLGFDESKYYGPESLNL